MLYMIHVDPVVILLIFDNLIQTKRVCYKQMHDTTHEYSFNTNAGSSLEIIKKISIIRLI